MNKNKRENSAPTMTDMFTGQKVEVAPIFIDDPTDAWIDGWNAGMNGEPKTPPTWLHLPSEHADWLDGYEAAKRD